jgi:hypothetical protein
MFEFPQQKCGDVNVSCLKTPVLGPETRGGRVTPGPDGPTAGWPGVEDFPAMITEGYPMPRVARFITSNLLETSHSNSQFGRVYVSWGAVGGRLSQKPKQWRFLKHLLIAVAGFGRCVFTIGQR